jgi:hypothetical protein
MATCKDLYFHRVQSHEASGTQNTTLWRSLRSQCPKAVAKPPALGVLSLWQSLQYSVHQGCGCRSSIPGVVDQGVAPKGFIPIERRTGKGSRSCEEQVGKGINHLA